MLRRFLANAAAILLFVGLTTGCASVGNESGEKEVSSGGTSAVTREKGNNGVYKSGFPITDEKVTLSVLTLSFPWETEHAKMKLFEEYEKMTGVHIEWEEMASTDLQAVAEKKTLMFQSGNMADVLMLGQAMSDQDLLTYGSAGSLVPASDYMDYLPNFEKVLQENPLVKKSITTQDGKIYGLPFISLNDEFHELNEFKLYINRKWLDNLSLDVPETVEDVKEVLRQFRENDPNNNQKKDEIPLSMPGFQSAFFVAPFGGPVYHYGSKNMVVTDEGKVAYGPSLESFKKGMEFMSGLLKEGLLDKDFLNLSAAGFQGKVRADRVGMMMSFAGFLDAGADNEDFIMMKPFPETEGGKANWTYNLNRTIESAHFVVTKACKNPEAAFRWADWFYTAEGAMNGLNGPEGIKWEKNEKGQFVNLGDRNKPETIENNMNWSGQLTIGTMLPIYLSNELNNMTVDAPDIVPSQEDLAYQKFLEDVEVCYGDAKPKNPMPYLMFNSEELDIFNELYYNIDSYYTQTLVGVINGDVNITAEWDNYVAELKKRGLDDLVKIYQQAYER